MYKKKIISWKSCKTVLSLAQFTPKRYNSSVVNLSYLEYTKYGNPEDVLQKKSTTYKVSELKAHEVLVEMLAAPINPADINTIQGVYAIKPSFPSIPGNEGIGKVLYRGKEVSKFKEDDWIIPKINAMGTWRTHAVFSETDLIKIRSDIDLASAATFAVNPATAYRMLHDFVELKPGDIVIQNGANSAVGQAAIQLAAIMGINTVNVVRDRPEINSLKLYLKNLGATIVVTEEELRKSNEVPALGKAKLALNCVSGKNAIEILRHLCTGGTMVTYGGMSRQPVYVSVSSLIFTDIRLTGFWMTRWSNTNAESEERYKMYDYLLLLCKERRLLPPAHTFVPFNNYKTAVADSFSTRGMVGKKQILKFC